MTLPSFLGIGASRSGSTWLDRQLRAHPDIYMPTRRKEVHFFDSYYECGIGWYERFFPGNDKALLYRAIGEFSPGYLSHPEAPKRIKRHLCDIRFLLILRDPVERAYSQWKYRLQKRAERRSFEQFMAEEEEPVRLSFYGEHLDRYFALFRRECFLILIFERVIANPVATLDSVASFLGIDADKFDRGKSCKSANVSFIPRFPRSYNLAFTLKQTFCRHDLDAL